MKQHLKLRRLTERGIFAWHIPIAFIYVANEVDK